tara:strand:- start:96 stop:896 length:801 start_codon:yes stop_codon:yes gene_type:complete
MSYPLLALREEVVKNDDLLTIILGKRANVKSLREVCELVDKYCNTSNRTCSEEVYRQIVVDAMDIRIHPGLQSWKQFMEAWCEVVKNPENYFDDWQLWQEYPVKYAQVQSLDWARRNGLLNYQSFDAVKLLENASLSRDVSLIAYLCNTYPITMETMVKCVHRALRAYCEYYRNLEMTFPRGFLEHNIKMLDAKQLLKIFDNHVTKVSASNRAFMNSRRYDRMLDKLQLFMNYAQPFPRYQDDIKLLRDWLDNKREEKENYLQSLQ